MDFRFLVYSLKQIKEPSRDLLGREGLLRLIGVWAIGDSTHNAADGHGAASVGSVVFCCSFTDAVGGMVALCGGDAGHAAGDGDGAA